MVKSPYGELWSTTSPASMAKTELACAEPELWAARFSEDILCALGFSGGFSGGC